MRTPILVIAAGAALGGSVALIVRFGLWEKRIPFGPASRPSPAGLSQRQAVQLSSQVASIWVNQSSSVTEMSKKRSLNGRG